jgi:hypothetical protein
MPTTNKILIIDDDAELCEALYLRAFALSFANIKQAMMRSLRSALLRSGQARNSSMIIPAPLGAVQSQSASAGRAMLSPECEHC